MSLDPGAGFAFVGATPRDEARRALARAFAAAAIDSAELDARLLLCAALEIDHAGLVRDPDRPLGAAAARVSAFGTRRLRREPVSRIIGYREFWRSPFKIDSSVLDPRPDTETLIEAVLDRISPDLHRERRLLDLGAGSGAILCALLQELPRSFGVGVDLSPAACAIARDNLAALGLSSRGAILCGDWTLPLRGGFDVLASNPPYIVRDEIAGLEADVRDFDPRLALDGGEDGLAAYRAIISAAPAHLAPGGTIALELGQGQRAAVEGLLRAAGFTRIAVRMDLAGVERVIVGEGGGIAI
ncbi:peptide chain release factor N(5)-glutamine methyltransferase [Methylocapsa acidiphila]|uniref:peptide chain release factor N(5)-glutamine methyltransferase n=1 Tax=Methylocapsa acidiphila TaxID=133552 RepID=UPI0003FFC11A|nr:peptide chain release factor N(5)-glutamine methyltransferase [Methylocapsa acidiphila]